MNKNDYKGRVLDVRRDVQTKKREMGPALGYDYDLPVVFGVLTTDTIEQALARAGEEHGNKGYEAAMTALEMAGLAAVLHTGE